MFVLVSVSVRVCLWSVRLYIYTKLLKKRSGARAVQILGVQADFALTWANSIQHGPAEFGLERAAPDWSDFGPHLGHSTVDGQLWHGTGQIGCRVGRTRSSSAKTGHLFCRTRWKLDDFDETRATRPISGPSRAAERCLPWNLM